MVSSGAVVAQGFLMATGMPAVAGWVVLGLVVAVAGVACLADKGRRDSARQVLAILIPRQRPAGEEDGNRGKAKKGASSGEETTETESVTETETVTTMKNRTVTRMSNTSANGKKR